MILPQYAPPHLSLYFYGYIILKYAPRMTEVDLLELYNLCRSKSKMEFALFLLALDWLYLVGKVVIVNNKLVLYVP